MIANVYYELCAIYNSKCFTHINSFTPHNNSAR